MCDLTFKILEVSTEWGTKPQEFHGQLRELKIKKSAFLPSFSSEWRNLATCSPKIRLIYCIGKKRHCLVRMSFQSHSLQRLQQTEVMVGLIYNVATWSTQSATQQFSDLETPVRTWTKQSKMSSTSRSANVKESEINSHLNPDLSEHFLDQILIHLQIFIEIQL